MATYSTQEQLAIRNGYLDVHHKRKENYKGEEREAKKSKFECGAKAVVDGTNMPFKTTAEKGDKGLGSLKAGNNITKKSTLPAEASSKEIITLEETLKNQADWFSYDHKCIDDEKELLAPSDWDVISLKGKENYKGEEKEAKKSRTQSKFGCGAKAVVDGTSKPSKTTAENSGEGLGSPKEGNNITKKSTLPGEELLAELEEALKDKANRFSYEEESAWLCISSDEEESLAPSDWEFLTAGDVVIPRIKRPPRPDWPSPDFKKCIREWLKEWSADGTPKDD